MREVIDIIEHSEWQEKFLHKIQSIIHDDHHNTKNYVNFEKRLPLYDCFTIVINNGVIEAASGLFNSGIYPKEIARALDRCYYFNWRESNPFARKKNGTAFSSMYMWPYQVNVAKELGYKAVFCSSQTIKTRRMLGRVCDMIEEYQPTLQDKLYNTCRLVNEKVNEEKDCWQNVGLYKFDETYKLSLPSMEISEYEKRY